MAAATFQRAREPEQKQQRRRELLAAARALLQEGGVEAVSLSAIARVAGAAKSNVYRYFEGREAILLEILVDDELLWADELEAALAPLAGSDDAEAVATTVARTVAARPVTCGLIAVVANVLEHGLSVPTALGFKTQLLEVSRRIRDALHVALPSLPPRHAEALLRYLHALVAGLWPMSRPTPAMAQVLAAPEFHSLRSVFIDDLAGALGALLRGLSERR
jgi:AcrR family transcriptional regulator